MIKLLLVEDDASLRYIVQGGLEDMIGGYEVIAAANGEEGLKQWKERHPDVIVSDIEMPVMNGYEMVKRIRETDGETPILFSSALISPKDVVKGYEIGANNYIKKPFIPEELDAHVHALLKLSKGEKSKDTSQCYKIGKEYVLDATHATLKHASGVNKTARQVCCRCFVRSGETLSAGKLSWINSGIRKMITLLPAAWMYL